MLFVFSFLFFRLNLILWLLHKTGNLKRKLVNQINELKLYVTYSIENGFFARSTHFLGQNLCLFYNENIIFVYKIQNCLRYFYGDKF